MTEFKLAQYERLTLNLVQLLKEFNKLVLNDTAKKYITGVPVSNINTNAVQTQYKLDNAKKLPNFDSYLKAGIDLSTQIPDCEVTKASIDAVVTLVKAFTSMKSETAFIAFDKTSNKFEINGAGEAAIDAAIIRLTPGQNDVYGAIKALFAMLTLHSSTLPGKLLNDSVWNSLTKELAVNSLVTTIRNNIK